MQLTDTLQLNVAHKEARQMQELYWRRGNMQVSQPIATNKMLGREPQRGDEAWHNSTMRRAKTRVNYFS